MSREERVHASQRTCGVWVLGRMASAAVQSSPSPALARSRELALSPVAGRRVRQFSAIEPRVKLPAALQPQPSKHVKWPRTASQSAQVEAAW